MRRAARGVAVAAGAAGLFAVPNVALGRAEPEWVPHMASHGGPAAAFALLAWSTVRLRRRKAGEWGGPAGKGSAVVLAGLVGGAAAQAVEAASARLEYPEMGVLHTGSSLAAGAALLLVGIGLVWLAAATLRVPRAARWALIGVGALALVLVLLTTTGVNPLAGR